MSRCKSCGAEIIWIRMTSGKNMPCNATKYPYRLDLHGDLTLVTPQGKVARGTYDPEGENIGYMSHFATCPAANRFRRRDHDDR